MRPGRIAVALALSVGACTGFEFETTAAPALIVATPPGYDAPVGYFGAGFAGCWESTALEVCAGARSDREVWAGLLVNYRLGWLLFHETFAAGRPAVWVTLTPGLGAWTWSDAPHTSGILAGARTGLAFRLNEYNTFALEYGSRVFVGSHDDGSASMSGVHATHTVRF
jgi:hypothetical protein